jgi:signal transduction histidine kinase
MREQERLLHALDLAMLGDWDGAKRSLEELDDPIVPRLNALMTEQQHRERQRAEAQAVARHELGNALSIAQANIEGMIDGVLEPSADRLTGIRDALYTCGVLLEDLKRHSRRRHDVARRVEVFDVRELVRSQVVFVTALAESKNVRVECGACEKVPELKAPYRGDPERIGHLVRNVLLNAVRYTPPGGQIAIDSVRPDGEVRLSVKYVSPNVEKHEIGFSLMSKLLEAMGGDALVANEGTDGATFSLRLPVTAS